MEQQTNQTDAELRNYLWLEQQGESRQLAWALVNRRRKSDPDLELILSEMELANGILKGIAREEVKRRCGYQMSFYVSLLMIFFALVVLATKMLGL